MVSIDREPAVSVEILATNVSRPRNATINPIHGDNEHRVSVHWVKIFTTLPLPSLFGSKKRRLKPGACVNPLKSTKGPLGERAPLRSSCHVSRFARSSPNDGLMTHGWSKGARPLLLPRFRGDLSRVILSEKLR